MVLQLAKFRGPYCLHLDINEILEDLRMQHSIFSARFYCALITPIIKIEKNSFTSSGLEPATFRNVAVP
jgi:hypothetical protein